MAQAQRHKQNGKAPAIDTPELPVALEAEQAVLGGMLISTSAPDKMLEILQPEDFYHTGHRSVFRAIQALRKQEPPVAIDPTTVGSYLQRTDEFHIVGGTSYLYQLCESIPTAAHIDHYSNIVLERWGERYLIENLQRFAAQVRAGEMSAAEASIEVVKLTGIVEERLHSEGPQTVTARELQSMKLPPLKFLIKDHFPQGLVLLHSDPKIGKTRFTEALAMAVATGGIFLGKFKPEQGDVLTIFLEDVYQTLQERQSYLFGGEQGPDNWTIAVEWPVLDKGGHRYIRRWLDEHPQAKCVVIDTLQMVRGQRERKDLYGEDVTFVRPLQKLAMQYGVCIILIHHSNKGKENSTVTGTSGTQGLAGTADTIMRLMAKGENRAEWSITGRFTPTNTYTLVLDQVVGWMFSHGQEVKDTQKAVTPSCMPVYRLIEELPRTPKQVFLALEMTGITQANIRQILHRLKKDGHLEQVDGTYYVAGTAPAPTVSIEIPENDPEREFRLSVWRAVTALEYPGMPAGSDWPFRGGQDTWQKAVTQWSPAQLRITWKRITGEEFPE